MASKKNKSKPSEDTGKLIRDNMKCPVCMEVLLPPIYQCETGHNICYLCVDEVSECPLCKGDYGDTRNYFAEELVNSMSFPCKFEDYGCTKTLLGSDLKDHQESCEFQPYRCPELACQEECGLHQMAKHLDRHGFKVMKGDFQQANIDIQDEHFDRKTEYNPWRIFAFNREFYTVSTRQKGGTWYFWSYCLGLPKEVKKYSCEIVVLTEGKQVLYRGTVHSLRTQPQEIIDQGNCLILKDDVIKAMRRNGKISCRVRFIQGKNWNLKNEGKITKKKGNEPYKSTPAKDPTKNPQKGKTRVLATGTSSSISGAALSRHLRPSTPLRPSTSSSPSPMPKAKAPLTYRPPTARQCSSTRKISSSPSFTGSTLARREKSSTTNVTPRASGALKALPDGYTYSALSPRKSPLRSRSSCHMQVKVSEEEQNFVMQMRETLRCPGCQEIITPPVHQCAIGHNCCHYCKLTRSDCAVCRAPIGPSRNFFAEELLYNIYQRCSYAGLGCKVCLLSAQMRSHEVTCEFAPFECPFNACRKQVGPHELLDHLKCHEIGIVGSGEFKSSLEVPKKSGGCVSAIPSILLPYSNKVPFFPLVSRQEDGSMSFFVTSQEPNAYTFEVCVKKMCKMVAYQGPVLSLRNNQKEIERNGSCLILTEAMIKNLKEGNKLEYEVRIYRAHLPLPNTSHFTFHSNILIEKSGAKVNRTELFANKKTSITGSEDEEDYEAYESEGRVGGVQPNESDILLNALSEAYNTESEEEVEGVQTKRAISDVNRNGTPPDSPLRPTTEFDEGTIPICDDSDSTSTGSTIIMQTTENKELELASSPNTPPRVNLDLDKMLEKTKGLGDRNNLKEGWKGTCRPDTPNPPSQPLKQEKKGPPLPSPTEQITPTLQGSSNKKQKCGGSGSSTPAHPKKKSRQKTAKGSVGVVKTSSATVTGASCSGPCSSGGSKGNKNYEGLKKASASSSSSNRALDELKKNGGQEGSNKGSNKKPSLEEGSKKQASQEEPLEMTKSPLEGHEEKINEELLVKKSDESMSSRGSPKGAVAPPSKSCSSFAKTATPTGDSAPHEHILPAIDSNEILMKHPSKDLVNTPNDLVDVNNNIVETEKGEESMVCATLQITEHISSTTQTMETKEGSCQVGVSLTDLVTSEEKVPAGVTMPEKGEEWSLMEECCSMSPGNVDELVEIFHEGVDEVSQVLTDGLNAVKSVVDMVGSYLPSGGEDDEPWGVAAGEDGTPSARGSGHSFSHLKRNRSGIKVGHIISESSVSSEVD